MNHDHGEILDIKAEITIDKPAAVMWKIVGENFGDIGEWSSGFVSSSMGTSSAIGASRVAEIAAVGPFKIGQIRRTLTGFDPDAKSFQLQTTAGLPGFFTQAVNR